MGVGCALDLEKASQRTQSGAVTNLRIQKLHGQSFVVVCPQLLCLAIPVEVAVMHELQKTPTRGR